MINLIANCMFLGVVWSLLGVLPSVIVSRKLHKKDSPPLTIIACMAVAGPIGGLIVLCAWIQQRGW